MLARFLPLATPFDSAEDPPGSIDPLGTVAGAEQLADVLFSGMTARMWRARHLTFAALAAHVADQAAGGTGTEDLRLEARLSLERLFVSAVARQERNDNQWKPASRRLPGIGLARRALAMGDQPLTKRTFLKGQAINGPFGVVSRVARNLKIIDDDNRLDRNGEALLIAWAKDQDLPGIFDGCPSNGAGTTWLNQLARQVVQDRCEWWPSGGWGGWEKLAQCLRPDRVGPRERKLIRTLLTDPCEPLRRRCVELLQCPVTLDAYRQPIVNVGRGRRDREVLFSAFRRLLQPASSPVDRTIYFVTDLIDAYEQVCRRA